MKGSGKKYNIVDVQGNYYKIDEDGRLVAARDSSDATLFSLREANTRIGTGRRSRFYNILEAMDIAGEPAQELEVVETQFEEVRKDDIETPALFSSLENDWEEVLTKLCFISDNMGEYQKRLNQMLSDVDKEICDLMHFLEINDLDDAQMLEACKMIQERRRHRREIKNEMERTSLIRETLLDAGFSEKAQQSLEVMQSMKNRCYSPRKLNGLFQQKMPA